MHKDKKSHLKNKRIIWGLVLLIAIIGIIISYFLGSKNNKILDNSVQANSVEENCENSKKCYPVYYYVVNNSQYSCKAKKATIKPLNDTHYVYYLDKNPTKCMLDLETTNNFRNISIITSTILLAIFSIIKLIIIQKELNYENYINKIDESKKKIENNDRLAYINNNEYNIENKNNKIITNESKKNIDIINHQTENNTITNSKIDYNNNKNEIKENSNIDNHNSEKDTNKIITKINHNTNPNNSINENNKNKNEIEKNVTTINQKEEANKNTEINNQVEKFFGKIDKETL